MIVGETIRFRHREAADAAFTATSAELEITLPDAAAEEDPPSVAEAADPDATEEAPANIYTSAPYEIAQAGAYRVVWVISVSGQTVRRRETYFAGWSDIPGLMSTRLYEAFQEAAEGLGLFADPDRVEREIASMVRLRLSKTYATAAGLAYNGIPAADRDAFDEAIARRVCAQMLHPSTTGGQAATDVVLDKSDVSTVQFAQISNATVATERDRWLQEAAELERTLSWYETKLQTDIDAYQSAGLNGRRRSALSCWPYS